MKQCTFRKNTKKLSLLVFSLMLGFVGTTMAATTPSLGEAATYGVIAGTYLNDSITNTVYGDVGFTTAPAAIPGPLGMHPSTTYPNYGDTANDTAQARIDAASALSSGLDTQPCTGPNIPGTDLGTDISHGTIGVYEPGVYCTDGAVSAANITLSGAGTYIFRIAGALNTTAGDSILLTNGASAYNVFWTPAAATTLGANTNFIGNVIDNANAINIGSNVLRTGRAISLGAGSVGTLGSVSYTISVPLGTINVIKTVINDDGGTAVDSDFVLSLHTAGGVFIGSGVGTGAPGTAYGGLDIGGYVVSEIANPNYTQTFTGDCSSTGYLTINGDENLTCTIINDDIAPIATGTINIIKTVINDDGGTAVATDFVLSLHTSTGVFVGSGLGTGTPGTTYTGLSIGDYIVSEPANANYTQTFAGDCSSTGLITLGTGGDLTCTITNNDIAVVIAPSGGGGGGSSLSMDVCIDGDYSPSYYDGLCGTAPIHEAAAINAPTIRVVKISDQGDTPLPIGGGDVVYIYTVTNPGNTPLTDVVVVDNKCAPLSLITGDNNHDHILDIGESWKYTCGMYVSVSTRNIVVAEAKADMLTVSATDYANVYITDIHAAADDIIPLLPKTGINVNGKYLPWNMVFLAGFLIFIIATEIFVAIKTRKSQR